MDSKCILCREAKDYRSSVFLAVNWDKLLNIMDATYTDIKTIENDSVCQNCNQFICTYDEFKSSILANEKVLKRHVETRGSSKLEELLVSAGQLDKYDKTQPVTCCRTCYKVTTPNNRVRLDSYQNFLGTLVLTCLPGLNIFLTEQCFVCSLCHNTLVAFHQFVGTCEEAAKAAKATAVTEKYGRSKKIVRLDDAAAECVDASSESEGDLLLPTNPPKGYEEYDNDDPTEQKEGRKRGKGRPKKKTDSIPTKSNIGVRKSKRLRGRPRGSKDTKLRKRTGKPKPLPLPETTKEILEEKELNADQPNTSTKPLRDTSQDRKNVQIKRQKLERNLPSPESTCAKKEVHQCQICPFTCPAQGSTIWLHLREHKNSFPSGVNCWKCGALLQSMGGMISHFAIHDLGLYSTVEEEEDDDNDDVVDKPSKQSKKIISNNVTEFIMAIQCELCQKTFENYLQFRHHRKTHIVDEVQQCPICPFSCNHITSMQTHLTVHHDINYLHKVITNSKVYKALLSDQTEIISDKEAEERVVTCEACSKEFTSIPDYACHDCPDKNKFCCGDCTFSFSTIDQLDSHKCLVAISKFKQLPDPNKVSNDAVNPTTSAEKPVVDPNFQCAKCVAGFHNENDLLSHSCNATDQKDESGFDSPVITAIKSECDLIIESSRDSADEEENVVSSSTTVDVQKSNFETAQAETDKRFICKGCKYLTTDEEDFKFHSGRCEKCRKCPYDSFVTDQPQDLEIHLLMFHSKIGYACRHCNFLAFDQLGMQTHNILTHGTTYVKEGSTAKEGSKQTGFEKTKPSESNQITTEPPKKQLKVNQPRVVGAGPPPLVLFEGTTNNEAPETETIAIDSDSEDEFIETPSQNCINASHIKEVVNIDSAEASKLISQGVPVVSGTAMTESPIVFFESGHDSSTDSNVEEIPLFNPNSAQQPEPDSHMDAEITEVAIPDSSTVDPLNIEEEGFVISDDDDDDGDQNPTYSQQSTSTADAGNTNKLPPKILVLNTEQNEVLKNLVLSDIGEKRPSTPTKKSAPLSFKLGENGVTITTVSKKEFPSPVKTRANSENDDYSQNKSSPVKTIPNNDEYDDLVISSDEDEDPVKATARKISSDNSWAKQNKNINGYIVFHSKVLETVKETKPGLSRQSIKGIILDNWRNMSEKEKYPFVEEARLRRSLVRRENPEMFKDKYKLPPIKKPVKTNHSNPSVSIDIDDDSASADIDDDCVMLD